MSITDIRPITAEEFQALQEQTGMGVVAAKRELRRQAIAQTYHYVDAIGSDEDKLKFLWERFGETLG